MKYIIRFLLLISTLTISTTFACNPLFDLCMSTAQNAIDACENQYYSDPSCECTAQKQLLACYSECSPDQVFVKEDIQMAKIADICRLSGAEAETKIMQKQGNGEFSAASVDEQSIPEPIHKDEISILGQTHAKYSAATIKKDEENSSFSSSSSSSSIILSTFNVFISASIIIVFCFIQ